MARPERIPAGVRRYIDTHARHGFLYQDADGGWLLEHCTDGDWGTCRLNVEPTASAHAVNMAAMRDLKRRPHLGPLPERLRGTAHR